MKSAYSLLALTILFIILAAHSVSAQRVAVRGHVVGGDGKPLPDAEIVLVSPENGQKFTMKTDKNGNFLNIGVVLGRYHLTLNKDGKPLFNRDVSVNGEEKVIDIDLPKAHEEQKQEELKRLTPEQQKQLEDQQKAAQAERSKIQTLNQMLAEADAALKAGNFDQAIVIYKQATVTDATQPVLWARLGEAYIGAAGKVPAGERAAVTEDYTEAVEAYKKAVELKTSEPAYHNNLGQAYAKLGKTDAAATEYTTAAQLDPSKAGLYYYNLGAVLTNAGKVDDANAAFDKSLAIDPNRADAYYWKGVNLLAKATLKDNKMVAPPGTAENLNKYLELAPAGSHAESAKELLNTLGAKIDSSYQKKK